MPCAPTQCVFTIKNFLWFLFLCYSFSHISFALNIDVDENVESNGKRRFTVKKEGSGGRQALTRVTGQGGSGFSHNLQAPLLKETRWNRTSNSMT